MYPVGADVEFDPKSMLPSGGTVSSARLPAVAPELILETGRMSVDQSVEELFGYLRQKEYLAQ